MNRKRHDLKRLIVISFLAWMVVSWWHRSCVRPQRPEHVEAYVQRFAPTAKKLFEISGVPPTLQLAVAGLETGWGSSDLARRGHNHFGIKATKRQPDICLETDEYYHRKRHRIVDCFRAYKHPEESYLDFTKFLLSNPRYAGLFKIPADDLEGWAKGLQEMGYATDPHYARKLMRVIHKYELQKL